MTAGMGSSQKIPLIVLAGSAKQAETISDAASHRLYGPKGLKIRLAGRPLIDVVIDRFRQTGHFDPIFVAGPADRYGATRGAAAVIDTDADFGRNIRAALESVVERLSPGAAAFTTCDVVPKVEELRVMLEDYRQHAPLDFWFPLIRVPRDGSLLGAAADKRQYRLIPAGAGEPVSILPSHLVIVDPRALRLALMYKAFELAYKSRTRPVFNRFVYITSGVFWFLVKSDLASLVRLRAPRLTFEVLWNAVLFSRRLGTGTITQAQVERHLHGLFGDPRHRRRYHRPGRVPVLDGLSLARDIDTVEEAEEMALEISQGL